MFDIVAIVNPPWRGIRAGSRWPRWCEVIVPGQGYVPFPFFLSYTSALISRDTEAQALFFDCIAEQISSEDFIDEMVSLLPDLIIMETCALSREVDINTAKKIKEEITTKICMVGPHATACPDYFLNSGVVDYVVLGEYEIAVKELVNGNLMPGVVVLGVNKFERTNLIDPLDLLPFPDRYSIPQSNYTTGFCRDAPNVQMHTSRGCIFKCSFCLWPSTLYRHTFRQFSIPYVIKEMHYILEHFPATREISFDDDTFTLRKDIPELCKQIIDNFDNAISWNCLGHVGVTKEEDIEWMAESGCEKVAWGFEIYGAAARKLLGKGMKPSTFEKVLRWCKEYGIDSHGTFMVGAPGETMEDAKHTIDFISYLQSEELLQHAQKSICTPFPGTRLYDEAVEKGWLVIDDLQKFDGTRQSVLSYPDFTKEEIEDAFRRMPIAGG